MDYKVDIKELKVEMAKKGFNGEDLAVACKVHPVTISRLLNGASPTYPLMCKITDSLQLTPERAAGIFFAPDLRNM